MSGIQSAGPTGAKSGALLAYKFATLPDWPSRKCGGLFHF